MDDSIKALLIRLIVIIVAFLFFSLGIDWRYGALFALWLIMTFLILRAYDDWKSFLRKCLLSLPFISIVELCLFLLIHPEHYTYWYTAAILFDALILKVPKLLLHYITTSFVAALSILLAYKKAEVDISLYVFCQIFLAFFCASYLLILNRSKDKFIYVLIKSIISAALVTLFMFIFTVSDDIADQYNIPLWYSYVFSCILGLVFFIVFYNLGKKYFKTNNLFKRGKILLPFCK